MNRKNKVVTLKNVKNNGVSSTNNMTIALNSFKIERNGAPKVLIIHGLMGSLRNWLQVGKALANNYEVHLLDLRNHGESPWSDSMKWEDMSSDLVDYFKREGIDKPIYLIGHSLGGKVAMHFATAYSNCVSKLVIIDIVPKSYDPHYKSEFEEMIKLDLKKRESRQSVSEALEEAIPEASFRESLLTNLTRKEGSFSWKPNLKILYENLEVIRRNPLSKSLTYNGKTFLIKGGASNFIEKGDFDLMRKYFPQLTFYIMNGVSHNPHVDDREALIKKLLEWL